MWSSPDLRDWKSQGQVLRFADTTWAKSLRWAPGIASRNGKFYLYFSADDQVGVAVADAPTRPFQDPLGKPLVAYQPDLSSIDPMAFVDDDGKGDGDRRVFVDRMYFEPDGSIRKIVPTKRVVRLPRPIRARRSSAPAPHKAGGDVALTGAGGAGGGGRGAGRSSTGRRRSARTPEATFELVWRGVPAGFHCVSAKATTARGDAAYSSWSDFDAR